MSSIDLRKSDVVRGKHCLAISALRFSLAERSSSHEQICRLTGHVRYFLDTEYNGWRGELISLALVPDDGDEEFYLTINCTRPLKPWVQEKVVPYLDMVPHHLLTPPLAPADAARRVSEWLMREHERLDFGRTSDASDLEILADWPEDISRFCNLLTIGPGIIVDVPPVTFRLLSIPGFSTAANSKIPHNALHDARALRDHVVAMD